MCKENLANVVLIGRTEEGRELAPRLAFRLGVGLAQDCLEVSVDPDSKRLLANRPVYGGNAVAVVSCEYTRRLRRCGPRYMNPGSRTRPGRERWSRSRWNWNPPRLRTAS